METEQPGDEVIDVDELTQSQETTEFKVDNVDDKLNKVLKIISKFNDAIEANDQKIEDLKSKNGSGVERNRLEKLNFGKTFRRICRSNCHSQERKFINVFYAITYFLA